MGSNFNFKFYENSNLIILYDKSITIFDINSGKILKQYNDIHNSKIKDLKFDESNNVIWSYSSEKINNFAKIDLNSD